MTAMLTGGCVITDATVEAISTFDKTVVIIILITYLVQPV